MTVDPSAPGWYEDPERPDMLRYWDGEIWTMSGAPKKKARELRGLTALFLTAFQIVKARGLNMLLLSFSVWFFWGLAGVASLLALVNVGEVNKVREVFFNVFTGQVVWEEAERTLSSLQLLKYSLDLSILVLSLLGIFYFIVVSLTHTAVSHQAYCFLEAGRRASYRESLLHALHRVVPGSSLLLFWYLICFGSVLFSIGILGYLPWLFTSNIWFSLLGGLVGLLVGLVCAVWLYTRWSLSGYAVALSKRPWGALSLSSRLTKGSRWAVFGRVVLIAFTVALVISTLSAPLDLVSSVVPWGFALLLIFLVFRVLLSAVSGALTAAASTSMYLDLGGDTYDGHGSTS